jgi:hypothetical protein
MNAQLQTQQKVAFAPTPSFTPVRSGTLQRKCACGGTPGPAGECEACRKKREAAIQRAAVTSASVGAVPPIVHDVLRSPGQPLDSATRGFMEPRFGRDFSQVRVHNGAKAAESAQKVNALAYTVGRDVVFGSEQFAPQTSQGRRLLAHELAHVVQQNDQNMSAPESINLPDDHYEHEANHIAEVVQSSATATDWQATPTNGSGWLQRNGDGRDRSRQSRPRDAPRGTVPIDQSDLDREDIHKIKDQIGAGPRDWVGITPDGEVITTDEEGNTENHGPASSYLRELHPEIPAWVWPLLVVVGIIVVAGIIACFATGVCEFAAVVGGLGYATALLILGLLRSAGIRDSGGGTTAVAEAQAEPPEEMA